MSSSFRPFMASEPETNNSQAKPRLLASAPEPSGSASAPKSTRGRKPSAKTPASGAKKLPQRGLGVAQLERLRIQEGLKKITGMPSPAAQQPPPLESVPVQFGAGAFGEAAPGRLVVRGPFGHPSGVVVDPRYAYNGMVAGASPHHHHHQDYQDQYVNQAARELSSTPKNHNNVVLGNSDDHKSLDICSFKKKRFSGEMNGNGLNHLYCLSNNESNFNNTIPNYNMSNIGDHLTLGFGTPNHNNNNSKVPRSSSIHNIVHNTLDNPHDQGVEVVAVHRRIGIGDNQDHVVKEYSFFPGQAGGIGKNDLVSSSKGTGFKKNNIHEPYTEMGSVSVGELEASYYSNNIVSASTTSTASNTNDDSDNSHPLDLSLKL